ncbi:hypothetical protein MNBD_GAMMA12-494 [hydrothermal vent metagenome]|uniref:Uncharacterized protein n=1 Tax=hydrothermal vent metagenome TaxID=652676 RepID=A0A3B0YRQ2_9ZZZZ
MFLNREIKKCLTNDTLRASEITTSEYAHRLIIAEELISMGCKWPILHERLGIRLTDAQRLMSENNPDGFVMSRVETGLNWFKKSGTGNMRMLHATYLYKIYLATAESIPNANPAEILLYAYRRYKLLTTPIYIDNINRAWYMISSVIDNRGFDVRECVSCEQSFLAIKLGEESICPACDRNQYIHCSSCQKLIDQPYVPGRNGSRKIYCLVCADTVRKEKRRLRERRKRVYIAASVLR